MRIGICDDDQICLNKTVDLIHNWKNKPIDLVVQSFQDGDYLIDAHKNHPFDLIFMDIVMPMFNGIDTCKEIRMFDKNVKIIFLTTSREFAIESYQVKATNYLLKPVPEETLYEVLDECLELFKQESKMITIKALSATFRIPLMNIEYVESDNKHILFHLIDGRILKSTMTLYTIENELLKEEYFFKCHRSYIINLHCVESFTSNDIQLYSESHIPISRNLKKEFEEIYFSIMFKESGDIE